MLTILSDVSPPCAAHRNETLRATLSHCSRTHLYSIYICIMTEKKLNYEAAMQRLEEIVAGFERNTLALDQLTSQLAEAQKLIKFCNEKLQKVETDVKKLLDNEQK